MAINNISRHILLTGPPGVGKTTLIQKSCSTLQKDGIPVKGFYTGEIREHGKRIGFDVITLDGQQSPLARIMQADGVGAPRNMRKVGQYTVQLHSFEMTAIPTLKLSPAQNPIYIIDEIGKMELFSDTFARTVQKVLDTQTTTCICTVPIAKGKPLAFVEKVKRRPDVQLFEISRENRDTILADIIEAVKESHKHFGKVSS